MNCKECKDTRIYQPFTGPAEPCQACADTQIKGTKSLYPISKLFVAEPVGPVQLNIIVDGIQRRQGLGCELQVNKEGRVTQGGPTVLALLQLKKIAPRLYAKLVMDDMVKVTICSKTCSDITKKGKIADTNINELRDISTLVVNDSIAPRVVDAVIRAIWDHHEIYCPICIDKDGVVQFGAATILALRRMQVEHPERYARLAPGGKISVTLEADKSTKIIISKLAHIKSLSRTMGWLVSATKSVREVLKAEMPADWSIDQRRHWLDLYGDFSIISRAVERMTSSIAESTTAAWINFKD